MLWFASPPKNCARTGAPRGRSLVAFFVLVFALSVPFWLVGAVAGRQLTADLPVSSFVWVCPVIAAAIVVFRERGGDGVRSLLRRSFDYGRIRAKIWYFPIVLLMPGLHALTYSVMRLLGVPLPAVQFPVWATLGWVLGYFVAAQCEELGWSGYALDPLQARWGALGAGVVLGMVWAAFHLVPLAQHGRSESWIAWWSLGTVALRVLIVWLYNNAGKSVLAAVLVHTLGNLGQIGPFLDFGPGGYPFAAQRIYALLVAATAAIVTVAWGPRTLTRARGARHAPAGAHASQSAN